MDIRKIFSKADILFADRGLAVVYKYGDEGFFSQSFNDENKNFIAALLSRAEKIDIIPEETQVSIAFHLKGQIDEGKMIIYPALEKMMSTKELLNMIEEKAIQEGISEEDVKRNIEEFDRIINEIEQEIDEIDIDEDNFQDMVEIEYAIRKYFDDGEIDGSCGVIELAKRITKRVRVDKDLQLHLSKIVNRSRTFEFEVDKSTKKMFLTFYG